jgi:hypothetical protein
LYGDFQLRRADFLDRWSQLVIRPGLSYSLNESVLLTAGVGYFLHHGRDDQTANRPELRPWQDVLLLQSVSKIMIDHRYRFEQRFINRMDAGQLADGFDFNYRMRYRLNAQMPLFREELGANTVYLVGYNELFVNFGQRIIHNHFDQNRLFIGLGYQHDKALGVQVGYMNLFLQRPQGNVFETQHMLRVVITHGLDLRRGEDRPDPKPEERIWWASRGSESPDLPEPPGTCPPPGPSFGRVGPAPLLAGGAPPPTILPPHASIARPALLDTGCLPPAPY